MKPNQHTSNTHFLLKYKKLTFVGVVLLAAVASSLIYYKIHTGGSNICVKGQSDIDSSDTPGVAKEIQQLEIKEDSVPISFETIVPSIRLLLSNLTVDLPFFESNYLRRYCEHVYPALQNLAVYFEMHIRNITDELTKHKEDLNHVFNFFLFSLKLINILNYYDRALKVIIHEKEFGDNRKDFGLFEQLLTVYVQEIYTKVTYRIIVEYYSMFKVQIGHYNEQVSSKYEARNLYSLMKKIYKDMCDVMLRSFKFQEKMIEFDQNNYKKLNLMGASFEDIKKAVVLNSYILFPFIFEIDNNNTVKGFNDEFAGEIYRKIEEFETNKIIPEAEIENIKDKVKQVGAKCHKVLNLSKKILTNSNWLLENDGKVSCVEALVEFLSKLHDLNKE